MCLFYLSHTMRQVKQNRCNVYGRKITDRKKKVKKNLLRLIYILHLIKLNYI